ncbi:MAG: sulfite exporter TauE/SafE family protein [Clostridia bacterium]|nr:sulfite exporter TauE/SafE family protein [Clostridia bacterium]
MNEKLSKNLRYGGAGVAVGVINGMFGAGGGMLAVPLLKRVGLTQREAHANAVAVILPVSVLTAVFYLARGNVNISDSLPFIPTGLIGAYLATLIIKRISPIWLKRIFGGFMIYAGVRLLIK